MTAVSTVTSHTISLHLQNRSGVLNRVVLTFSRRGWNIDSLSVSHELDDSTSRCSIVASGDAATLNLIVSQLKKLIDVIDAYEEEPGESTERELALFRVMLHADDADIETVLDGSLFRCIQRRDRQAVYEVVDSRSNLDRMVATLSQLGGLESVVRTGSVIMPRS